MRVLQAALKTAVQCLIGMLVALGLIFLLPSDWFHSDLNPYMQLRRAMIATALYLMFDNLSKYRTWAGVFSSPQLLTAALLPSAVLAVLLILWKLI